MSSKCTRVIRSSSAGEFAQLDEIKPTESPVAPWEKKRATAVHANSAKPVQKPVEGLKVSVRVPERPAVKVPKVSVTAPERPRRSILTFTSPVRENKNERSEKKPDERFGNFLETCYLCKKKLAQGTDVFMYGYLRAFCTPECREDQIALDGVGRKPSPIAEAFKMIQEPVKRMLGSQGKTPNSQV